MDNTIKAQPSPLLLNNNSTISGDESISNNDPYSNSGKKEIKRLQNDNVNVLKDHNEYNE